MELVKRFEEATATTANTSISISLLVINKLYPIVQVKRVSTKYGPTVLLSLWDSNKKLIPLFLPKRYANVVSDMEKISSRSVYLNLVYKSICELTRSYLLAIDS